MSIDNPFLNDKGNMNALGYMHPLFGIGSMAANGKFKPKINARKTMVEAMAKDVATLQNNPSAFGMTGAEKRQMVDATAQQAGAQRQNAINELSRDALAGQGFQQGAFQSAAKDIAGGAAADVASAQAAAQQLSNEKIEAARARIMGEVEKERLLRRENKQYAAQFGLDTAEMLGQLAGMMTG